MNDDEDKDGDSDSDKDEPPRRSPPAKRQRPLPKIIGDEDDADDADDNPNAYGKPQVSKTKAKSSGQKVCYYSLSAWFYT